MLNSNGFVLLAGNPQKWDDEIIQRCRTAGAFFNSEDLCRVQMDQAGRGRLSAHMVLSIHGWTVRYASGLQNFGILFKSTTNDPQVALDWGCKWANQDPDNREFYVAKYEIESAEKKGIDCSCLTPARTL